jgi:hypothetical protein
LGIWASYEIIANFFGIVWKWAISPKTRKICVKMCKKKHIALPSWKGRKGWHLQSSEIITLGREFIVNQPGGVPKSSKIFWGPMASKPIYQESTRECLPKSHFLPNTSKKWKQYAMDNGTGGRSTASQWNIHNHI